MQFRLALHGKKGKEIPEPSRLEFLEKFFYKLRCFIRSKRQHSGPSNRGGIVDLPFLRILLEILQKTSEPSSWEVMDSCFSSICKFGSFKNLFSMITSLTELYFRFRRFTLLVKTKKVISMNYGNSTSCSEQWR